MAASEKSRGDGQGVKPSGKGKKGGAKVDNWGVIKMFRTYRLYCWGGDLGGLKKRLSLWSKSFQVYPGPTKEEVGLPITR